MMQPSVIALPVRTRAILEKKIANRAALQALLQAEEQAINDLVAAAREMLGVPDTWLLRNTEQGFTAPIFTDADPAEIPTGDDDGDLLAA